MPANALVGPSGAAPTGMLTAHLATLNIADGEAPGDWGAMLGGKETNLISYGATFVEFRDAAGVKYNLAPGMEAKVEMFTPPGMLAGAPATARFWSYDETDGFWKESGGANFVAGSGSFDGRVKHFSTINTDVEKDDDACLKVLIYPPIPTGVKLRVTDPTGAVFTQAFEVVLDAGINAVYRLPANTNVRLELFDADNSAYDGALLLEEVPGVPLAGNIVNTGPPIPAGQSSFPPEPYEPCKLVILREANAPTANAFLAFKGAGNQDTANGYYGAVDPNNERLTLGAWWNKNGFTFDASGVPTNAVRTSYLNFNDLGSGRDMYFLQRGDGTVAAYVTNYGLFNQDHGNADLAANRDTPGATVAMEYGPVEGQGPTRIVKFFVYAGADFATNAPRAPAADLDGFGAEVRSQPLPQLPRRELLSRQSRLADIRRDQHGRGLPRARHRHLQVSRRPAGGERRGKDGLPTAEPDREGRRGRRHDHYPADQGPHRGLVSRRFDRAGQHIHAGGLGGRSAAGPLPRLRQAELPHLPRRARRGHLATTGSAGFRTSNCGTVGKSVSCKASPYAMHA